MPSITTSLSRASGLYHSEMARHGRYEGQYPFAWHYDASIGSLSTANFPHHSMRLVPIVGGARIHMERHRKQHGGKRRVLHHMLHHRQGCCDLIVRHLED